MAGEPVSDMPQHSRDTRAMIVGAAVILVALVAARGAPALSGWTRRQEQRAVRSSIDLADARSAIALAASLRDSARAGRSRVASLDSAFVTGNSVLRGAANLASELSENVEVVGARVDALQADSVADASSAVRRVRVRGSVSGELATLMQFIMLVETGPRLLVISDLALSRREAASATQAERIQANFVVEGLVRPAKEGAAR